MIVLIPDHWISIHLEITKLATSRSSGADAVYSRRKRNKYEL